MKFFKSVLSNVKFIISTILGFMIANDIIHSEVSTKSVIIIGILFISTLAIGIYESTNNYNIPEFNPKGVEPISQEDELNTANKLVSKFVDDIMKYCIDLGINPTIGNLEDAAWILDVDNENNITNKVAELVLPDGDILTESNYEFFFNRVKEKVDKYTTVKVSK